jgi:hypothetical protein
MAENDSDSLPFEPPEQENLRLREENARLRRLLAVHSIPIPQVAPPSPPAAITVETLAPIDREERARKRIALFRSLFRGREDVYARRWRESRTRLYRKLRIALTRARSTPIWVATSSSRGSPDVGWEGRFALKERPLSELLKRGDFIEVKEDP